MRPAWSNAAAPAVKRTIADLVGAARFADVAVTGSVPAHGAATSVLVSGSGSARAAAFFERLGATVADIGGAPGDASGRKLLRSTFMKGLGALVVESVRAGRAAGAEEWVREQIARELAGGDAAVNRLRDGTLKHASRRAGGRPLDHRQGPALDVDVLDRALRAQNERVRPGDLVLVHTGWARWFLDANPALRGEVRDARRATGFRQTGDLPEWLWDHQVALFATDTFAVEVLPVATDTYLASAPEDAGMMHQELIAKLGVPLGELWNLAALVADSRTHGRWDALVTVKPLNLVGGVGSPPNATALR
jgi:kynurenine formamidase